MSQLVWNEIGERLFEAGVDRCVLYPNVGSGVAWSGVVAVNEASDGGDITPYYYDGVKYLDVVASEDYSATLEAYSAPVEFNACDGNKTLSPGLFASQQPRKTFGLSYRTLIGNDLESTEYGYKLHIVYGCTAAPSARNSVTLSGTPSPGTRSWQINTVPPRSSTYKPTAHFVVDSTLADPAKLAQLERFLYGTPTSAPTLAPQSTVISILA